MDKEILNKGLTYGGLVVLITYFILAVINYNITSAKFSIIYKIRGILQ
jgi:hypothetical protein